MYVAEFPLVLVLCVCVIMSVECLYMLFCVCLHLLSVCLCFLILCLHMYVFAECEFMCICVCVSVFADFVFVLCVFIGFSVCLLSVYLQTCICVLRSGSSAVKMADKNSSSVWVGRDICGSCHCSQKHICTHYKHRHTHCKYTNTTYQYILRKRTHRGSLCGSAIWRLPSAQGVDLESRDWVPLRALCMEPASPSACVSASLSVCLSWMNK